MKLNLPALILAGALACSMGMPAAAAGQPVSAPTTVEDSAVLPASVLYYGRVENIVRQSDGAIRQLHLSSQRYGDYVMNISDETLWIDSGACAKSDPATLEEGESLYIFHSPVATMSMPPQSSAIAVVRNIPMDVGCAQYHKVEAVSAENGTVQITTDNGGLHILADDETGLSSYDGAEVTLDDIQAGDAVMAWYSAIAESYPAQTHASHLMLLPRQESKVLTRGELVAMLHTQAGNPTVNYAMQYTDVAQDHPYAEAIRWATSEQLVSGYDNGAFGPEDTLSREQLVTILWRAQGSPMLMDYPGLSEFSDVSQISSFAQPALCWAHQQGLLSWVEGDTFSPQSPATSAQADAMLAALH